MVFVSHFGGEKVLGIQGYSLEQHSFALVLGRSHVHLQDTACPVAAYTFILRLRYCEAYMTVVPAVSMIILLKQELNYKPEVHQLYVILSQATK